MWFLFWSVVVVLAIGLYGRYGGGVGGSRGVRRSVVDHD